MTDEFRLTNCILAMAIVLVLCTYIALIQCIKQDAQINKNYEIKTVAAFNA